MRTTHLVDGNGLLSRYVYANAAFGVANFTGFLQRIAKHGDVCICVFDSPSPRSQMKAAVRKEKPPELVEALKRGPEIAAQCGFNVWKEDGFEGDQLIGHFARTQFMDAERDIDSGPIHVYSDDKDFVQLLSIPGVHIFRDLGRVEFTRDMARTKYGFEPEHIADYLALAGDSNDGIKGVRGIGEVGATKLIQQFSSKKRLGGYTEEASVVSFLLSIPDTVLKQLGELEQAHKLTLLREENLSVPKFKPHEGPADALDVLEAAGVDLSFLD